MPDLKVRVMAGQIALFCDDPDCPESGWHKSVASMCRLSDLVAAEQEHTTDHITQQHKEAS